MAATSKRAARLVCALAVLIGLFGMHGLATAQAGGCHVDDGVLGIPSVTPSMTSSAAGSSALDPADAVAMVTAHRMVSAMASTMAGASCLFVSPTGWPLLPLVVLALVAAAVWLCAGWRWAAWMSGRSPPRSGVSLLRWMCVSRT
jgi:hypothetical protein